MAMVCPQCGTAYDQRIQCANCKARLLFQQEEAAAASVSMSNSWQQTGWGRLIIGLVLAQGLYWGLRHLTTALILSLADVAYHDLWSTLLGFIILLALQAISISVGALLAGAGQKQGLMYGTLLGLWNGGLCLILQLDQPYPVHFAVPFITPLAQGMIGGLMGWLGSYLWQPIPNPITPTVTRRVTKSSTVRRSIFDGPIAWWRVLVGSALAVSGTLLANSCLELVERNGGRVESHGQETLLTGEIIALAMLGGSALAGATTLNGIKQGLITGLLTAVMLTGIYLGQSKVSIDYVILTALSAIVLGFVGGGFGSQLIPPLVRRRVRSLDHN